MSIPASHSKTAVIRSSTCSLCGVVCKLRRIFPCLEMCIQRTLTKLDVSAAMPHTINDSNVIDCMLRK